MMLQGMMKCVPCQELPPVPAPDSGKLREIGLDGELFRYSSKEAGGGGSLSLCLSAEGPAWLLREGCAVPGALQSLGLLRRR